MNMWGTRLVSPVELRDDNQPSLHGRTLFVARAAWLVVALVAIVVTLAGQSTLYRQYRALEMYDVEMQRTVRENLADLGLSADVYGAYLLVFGLMLAFACFVVAVVIFVRHSHQPMALLLAAFLVLLGATFSGAINAVGDGHRLLEWLPSVWGALLLQSMILLFCLFPNARFVPRWTRWVALTSALLLAAVSLLPGSSLPLDNWPSDDYGLLLLTVIVLGLAAQAYRYWWISGYWQRRQTTVVAFGIAVAFAGSMLVALLPVISPIFQPGTFAQLIAIAAVIGFMLLIPFSILRWDIDLVINRTLVYTVVTGLLLAAYFVLAIALQSLFRAVTGQSSVLAIIISTLLVATLFQPLRGRVQRFIDRRFYRRRYDPARTLTEFGARVRNEIDLPAVTSELVLVVRETMQPASISLWLPPTLPGSAEERRKEIRQQAEIRGSGRFMIS
jgi:hypothetical protein